MTSGVRRALTGVFFAAICTASLGTASAEDVSAPAMLQIFEARWHTVDNRMADIFKTGYGGLWLPPPARADTGGFSAGYDVFDRFDLGSPRDETLVWDREMVSSPGQTRRIAPASACTRT